MLKFTFDQSDLVTGKGVRSKKNLFNSAHTVQVYEYSCRKVTSNFTAYALEDFFSHCGYEYFVLICVLEDSNLAELILTTKLEEYISFASLYGFLGKRNIQADCCIFALCAFRVNFICTCFRCECNIATS